MHTPEEITARDWFAAMALASMSPDHPPKTAAESAYRLADAMLKERALLPYDEREKPGPVTGGPDAIPLTPAR